MKLSHESCDNHLFGFLVVFFCLFKFQLYNMRNQV